METPGETRAGSSRCGGTGSARDGRGVAFGGSASRSGRAGRPVELAECHHHETLLNLAFGSGPSWRLICPYDTAALPAETVQRARSTHPVVSDAAGPAASQTYSTDYAGCCVICSGRAGPTGGRAPVRDGRPAAGPQDRGQAGRRSEASRAGDGFRHRGQRGGHEQHPARRWGRPDHRLVDRGQPGCQINDRGYIDSPLIGRQRPAPARRRLRAVAGPSTV